MALNRQAPSAGGFAGTASQPITKPINSRLDNGKMKTTLGTSYKRNTFKNRGPSGIRSRRGR